MKFIIHDGEDYYPSVEEFDDYSKAKEKFDELIKRRKHNLDKGYSLNSEVDYLATVIDKFDADEYRKLVNARGINEVD